MKFHELGDQKNPHIMLIHGGGNSWWNYLRQARVLAERYHVILPTLDGHGEEWEIPYVSTEETAGKLLSYLDSHCGGHLFLLAGVSLGGQIVIELLSQRADITEKAVIDGSVCIPKPFMARCCALTVRLLGGLMFSEKACRFQLKQMDRLLPEKMCYPEEIKAYYLEDMPRTPRETLYTIYRTYMAGYQLKDGLRNTKAQVEYWYGQKEMKAVKDSAKQFQSMVPQCIVQEFPGCNHGYLAIYLPEEWLEEMRKRGIL